MARIKKAGYASNGRFKGARALSDAAGWLDYGQPGRYPRVYQQSRENVSGLLPFIPEWSQTHPQDGKFDRHKALAPSRKIVKDNKENAVPYGYEVVLVFPWQGGLQLDSFYSCVSCPG
jgi:hypothetical protein